MTIVRAVRILIAALPMLICVPAFAQRTAAPPRAIAGDAVAAIKVVGNQRIEEGTIRSYLLIRQGERYDQDRVDRSLKVLFATGLFQDVRLTHDGNTVTVHVVENPIVNRVAFEGNKKLTDEQLRPELQLKPRAVFTSASADQDRRHILDMLARRGYYNATVEPRIIRLDQNRVDVVFEIVDGQVTLVSRIAIVGNKAFSQGDLTDAIDSREQRWWRFLSSSDQYDPERVNYDKELLRRFYLKHGYADFEVIDARGELSPDRTSFFLTYTINEGQRYKIAKLDLNSKLRGVDGESLRGELPMGVGDWYDGDAIPKIADQLEAAVHNRGVSFVQVQPRVERNREKHTVDIAYDITEGPRVFIERIDIVGNVRTMDKVVRREMRLAEGDPLNPEAIRRSRQRLKDLNYFSDVDIKNSPGSAPDKAVLTVSIAERATGELSFGGGYSTDAGALVNIGLAERNLIGTGIDASINGVLAQKRSSVSLSVTEPHLFDRNLAVGFDAFMIQTQYLGTEPYDERRVGFSLRGGYEFNEHLRQVWTYSLINRNVYNILNTASPFIQNQAGQTVLSQIGQTLTLDYRDSRLYPHSGFVTELQTDFAGLGGDAKFFRPAITGAYYIPLDAIFGNDQWGVKVAATVGYLYEIGGKDLIIDRFFLGGDNLRGFQTGGAGPHDRVSGDPVGGRFMWTQTTELRFPLPVSADLGLNGRAFVDVGALTNASFRNISNCVELNGAPCSITQSAAPRVGAGFGISWRTQFGLINIDLAPFVVRQPGDQTQLFRFGFGTRF